jgi:hypothetical protein
MSTVWGNPDQHNEAFRQAVAEFYEQRPNMPRRPFTELRREDQTRILARQVELYQSLLHAH